MIKPLKVFGLSALACIVLGVSATSAFGYDRPPIHLSGLTPDGWGQTVTGAASALRARYDDVQSVYCGGVFIDGYPKGASSWVTGTVRFWDKLYCAVRLSDGTGLIMVFDQRGRKQNAYTIYRVKPLST